MRNMTVQKANSVWELKSTIKMQNHFNYYTTISCWQVDCFSVKAGLDEHLLTISQNSSTTLYRVAMTCSHRCIPNEWHLLIDHLNRARFRPTIGDAQHIRFNTNICNYINAGRCRRIYVATRRRSRRVLLYTRIAFLPIRYVCNRDSAHGLEQHSKSSPTHFGLIIARSGFRQPSDASSDLCDLCLFIQHILEFSQPTAISHSVYILSLLHWNPQPFALATLQTLRHLFSSHSSN